MLKIISDSAWSGDLWNEDNPRVALIKVASNGLSGLDKQKFVKRACASSDELLAKLASIKVNPGEELAHEIALGATEFYGPNRNGDGFRKEACRKYHNTFVKHGHCYRDHQNTDPKKSYGVVKASAYNEGMGRVELIVAYNGDERAAKANGGLVADKEMEKLASGKDIPLSMACLTDPDYPILTKEYGYIPIKDIVVGNTVWTKDSGWQQVTAINRRPYSGKVYKLSFNGLPFPLEITGDHLLWVKHFAEHKDRAFRGMDEFNAVANAWCPAEQIAVDDRVFYNPIRKYDGFAAIDDADLAAIMGYYVAEGCIGMCKDKPNTVSFICNLDDSLPRRVPEIMQKLYPEVTVKVAPHRNSKEGLVVTIFNAALAKYINFLIGRGCKNKIVPPEIFNADDAIKKSFLGGWIDGDGWVDGKGTHISTSSFNLALQARDLFVSLGIPTSIYKIDHTKCATSGKPNSGIEYNVNISNIDSFILEKYSSKVAASNPEESERKRPAAMLKAADGLFAYRVKAITSRDATDIVTYNFEVASDPSYSAAGVISHNCSVPFDVCSYCGNKAETQDNYCRGTHEGGHCKAGGLKHNMGQLVSVDGELHHLHADNTKPDFFDISHVFVPADRIAYSSGRLTKSASARQLSGAELARQACLTAPDYIQGAMNSNALYFLKEAVSNFHNAKLWQKRASFLGVMNSKELKDTHIPRRYKFAEVQRALLDAGVCLNPTQYVQLVSGLPYKQAAFVGEIIAPLSNDFLEKDAEYVPEIPQGSSRELRNWVYAQHLPSVFPDRFMKQAALASLEEAPPFSLSVQDVYDLQNDPQINALAKQYGLYKAAFVAGLPTNLQQTAAELIVGRDYLSF